MNSLTFSLIEACVFLHCGCLWHCIDSSVVFFSKQIKTKIRVQESKCVSEILIPFARLMFDIVEAATRRLQVQYLASSVAAKVLLSGRMAYARRGTCGLERY